MKTYVSPVLLFTRAETQFKIENSNNKKLMWPKLHTNLKKTKQNHKSIILMRIVHWKGLSIFLGTSIFYDGVLLKLFLIKKSRRKKKFLRLKAHQKKLFKRMSEFFFVFGRLEAKMSAWLTKKYHSICGFKAMYLKACINKPHNQNKYLKKSFDWFL